jgi:aerobic C4-dicarboxylate transport protein
VVGIDRIMSEGRALTNAIGNSVATLVIARWQGELDEDRLRRVLEDPELADRAVEEKLRGAPDEDREGRFEREPQPALITPASARTAGATDGSGRFA